MRTHAASIFESGCWQLHVPVRNPLDVARTPEQWGGCTTQFGGGKLLRASRACQLSHYALIP